MTKIYLSKVIGDGKSMETARKPEINRTRFWTMIEDLGDYMIIEADETDLSKYGDTTEI